MNTLLSENVSYVRRGDVEKSAAISGYTSAGIYIDSNILNNKAVRSVAHKILVDSIYANISKSDSKLIFKNVKILSFKVL